MGRIASGETLRSPRFASSGRKYALICLKLSMNSSTLSFLEIPYLMQSKI
jgi:hypothetical protein